MLAAPHLLLALVVGAAAPAVEAEVDAPAGSDVEVDVDATAAEGDAPSAPAEPAAEADASAWGPVEPAPAAPVARRKLPQPEYGPFFEPEPPSESAHPSDPPPGKPPALSVGGGAFCFVEDAQCRISLLASADIGLGVNIPAGDRGVDVPMSQWGFRGGLTLRPVTLLKHRWHRWAIGVTGGFARSSGALATTFSSAGDSMPDFQEVIHTNATRVALLNQLWLSQKRNAVHLDFELGVVRSEVLTSQDRFWGTHADLALGVGGWGSVFFGADFLDQDTRLVFGLRGHAIGAAPIAALVLLGLLAGGGL